MNDLISSLNLIPHSIPKKRVSPTDWKSGYTAIFNPEFVPMTPTIQKVVDQWKSDDEFSRKFLQGVNPYQIKMVQKPGDISKVGKKCCNFLLNTTNFFSIK